MKNLKFFAIILLMLISAQVWGQQLQVQGNVSDKANGEPLIGLRSGDAFLRQLRP